MTEQHTPTSFYLEESQAAEAMTITERVQMAATLKWYEGHAAKLQSDNDRLNELLHDQSNAHDDLVAALEQSDMDLSVISDCIPKISDRNNFLEPVRKRIKEALAKAKAVQ